MIYFIIWCIIFVISILIELISPGFFFFLSFSIGAACSAIISLFSDDLVLQIISFIFFSISAFIMLRYWLYRDRSDLEHVTNVYALIGKSGIVFEEIRSQKKGAVKINGEIWSAKSVNNEKIEKGELVEVLSVKGAHLIVKKI